MRALVRLIAIALPLLFAPAARAEGLVQLTFDGEVSVAGGAPIELELGIWDEGKVRQLSLNIHLAQRTSAADLAALLASRLDRVGARSLLPRADGAGGDTTHVFIESVTHVYLRLGHGLSGSVTLCDAAPTSVRVQPPEIHSGGSRISIAATTFHPHNRHIARKELTLDLDELDGAAEVSEELARASIEAGWMADRPSPDRWAASRTNDGAEITGCSVELAGEDGADWRLEVELEVPRAER